MKGLPPTALKCNAALNDGQLGRCLLTAVLFEGSLQRLEARAIGMTGEQAEAAGYKSAVKSFNERMHGLPIEKFKESIDRFRQQDDLQPKQG